MPPAEELGRAFAARGIGDDTRVILYARASIQWATRIWWMLRALGFDNAAVLDGGWNKWRLENRPQSSAPCGYQAAALSIRPRPELFVAKDRVLGAIGDPSVCTINALAADLHSGENPRYGRPGRIPGSVNVPAAALLEPETLAFAEPKAAAQAFAAAGAAPDKASIVYCGGGIAATLDAFLMHQLGYHEIAVYDASMSEWASDPSLPIETDVVDGG